MSKSNSSNRSRDKFCAALRLAVESLARSPAEELVARMSWLGDVLEVGQQHCGAKMRGRVAWGRMEGECYIASSGEEMDLVSLDVKQLRPYAIISDHEGALEIILEFLKMIELPEEFVPKIKM